MTVTTVACLLVSSSESLLSKFSPLEELSSVTSGGKIIVYETKVWPIDSHSHNASNKIQICGVVEGFLISHRTLGI